MKISAILRRTQRKGITPIIATVLIIAVTLIAAVAIAGFVFGIFGTATSTANVAAISATASHGAAGTLGAQCSAESGANSYVNILLSNSGTAATTVTSVSLTTGGTTVTATVASCTIGASGATSAPLPTQTVGLVLSSDTTGGQVFNGYVSLANGAEVIFTGTFT